MLHNKRGRDNERPVHRDEDWPPLAAARESPRTEMKTQHSHKKIKKKKKSRKGKATNTYKGITIRLTADLSAETLQGRRERQDIFKVMTGKNLQPRLLYQARITFRFDREAKDTHR